MSIACPYCKAVLTPKGLKPGKYTPKCPKCTKPFLLVVPDDEGGTISIQQLAQKKPPTDTDTVKNPEANPDTVRTPAKKPPTAPGTDKLPAVASRPPSKTAPPDSPTDKIKKPSGTVAPPPKKKAMSVEDAAAAMLEGKDPDELTDDVTESDEHPKAADPNSTGDFTEAEAPAKPAPKKAPAAAAPAAPAKKAPGGNPPGSPKAKPADPNTTGDFTEMEAPEPPAKKPAPKKADPNVTGDFTEAEAPAPAAKKTPGANPTASTKAKPEPKADPNVTGDHTETDDHVPLPAGGATGDFTEAAEPPANDEEPEEHTEAAVLKPKKKVKAKPDAEVELDSDVPPKLGGYEVLRVLGKGGMGAVLLGRQISLDRKVALKVMHPRIAKNPGFVARFTREAYAAAQLTHHNVVQIYDIGEDRGQHFFSMEFVQGQSLMDMVKKEGKLAPEVAVGYILQASRGLRYGHAQGMVHRDIKPDNLMINTEGIVKVADLGLVKLPGGELPPEAGALEGEDGEEGKTELTRAGAVMGTPAYMSPEQSRDSATVDGRADIYSLGCTLYVLVTGKTPFEGKTALEVISKHQSEPMKPPELIVKRIPKSLSAIVLKMTAKKQDERYQSMDEVIVALEHFLGLEKSGTFNPKEEQADQLEKCAHQFNFRSKSGLKKTLTLGFVLACIVGIVGGAVAGMPALAGGLVGLLLMTPLAYFVIHGTMTGSVVFGKAREVVFGMRFFDWVMWFGGGLLFLATLYLFGMLWAWLGFAALALLLGFVLWFITDRAQEKAQELPLEEARALFKSLRLSGLDEEQLRQFVCKFSGTNWEPFYEAVFGYEAKLAARAYRKGDTGEVSKKSGAWREVVMAWLDTRLEARRLAKERKHLQKVEAKALEAEGVSKSDAKVQAEAMADDLVGQVAEAKQARKEGKEVSVLQVLRAARERRKPKPGYNLAGVKLQSLWLKDFLNNWLGRRLRIVLGAMIFAVGLFWMHQNDLFGKTNIFKQVMELDFAAAGKTLDKATGKALQVPDFLPIPSVMLEPFSSINVVAMGFCLILCGVFFYGWRPTLVALPGLIIGIAGPMLGVPEVGPLSANLLCLIVGVVLIIPVAWVLRQ